MKSLYRNNQQTTLTVALDIAATDLPQASLTVNPNIGLVSPGEVVIATLTNPDETVFEIVHIIKSLVSSYTIVRAREGTVAATWPVGSVFSLRITAAMLNNFPQTLNGNNISSGMQDLQQKIYTAVDTPLLRANSSAIFAGEVKKSPLGIQVYLCLVDGTTAVSEPSLTSGTVGKDGTAVVLPFDVSIGGAEPDGTLTSPATALGIFASAINGGVALGNNAIYSGTQGAVATGSSSLAVGSGIALGIGSSVISGGVAIGDGAMVIGGTVGTIQNSLATTLLAARPTYYQVAQRLTNLVSVIWSRPFALNTPPLWAASTQYKQGDIIRNSVDTGVQFVRKDNNYNAFTVHFGGYTAGSSGATEPTWNTADLAETTDGNGVWVATQVARTLPFGDPGFITEEIGIMAYDSSAVTVQPTIRFDNDADTFQYVPPTTTTALGTANRVQRFQVLNTQRDNLVRMRVNTEATATRLNAQFYVKGFFAQDWR